MKTIPEKVSLHEDNMFGAFMHINVLEHLKK